MLFFLISCFSFLLFTSKLLLPVKPLPSWVNEMSLVLVLFCQEFLELSIDWLKNWRLFSREAYRFSLRMSAKKCSSLVDEHVEEAEEMTILDLPELALECVLGKLSPAGLSRTACVCSTLRNMCRSDHLWERHLKVKWGQLLGRAALREWESAMASKKDSFISSKFVGSLKPKGWMDSLSRVWPLSWLKFKLDDAGFKLTSPLPADSLMSLYLALESGKFWFPAQVYNRENGHVGFMLSCYDAELSYDGRTDTFFARYPPHGQRPVKVEEGVQWHRLRAPPVDTPPHDLHASDCLNDLRPGDHIEIQWRKSKEFPYGWWYGVVGHLGLCDGNEHHCLCHKNDTIVVEFNQYTPGSRWRQATISRKDHREEGNETDGFYGGIRKLQSKDEISMWRRLWPAEVLE